MARFTEVFRFSFLVLMMVLLVCIAHGQKVTISVSDSTALEDAVIRIVPISKTSRDKAVVGITEKDGSFAFNYTEPVELHINYLGYLPIIDVLNVPESRTYRLRKSTANIEDIVVTGQYAPGSAKASVYSVAVVSEKEFREKGATNLREALQNNIGIEMSQDQVFGSGISLQGISGQGVKVMIDGVPLQGRQDGILDISQINLSNIERVEIIKGPMSAVYGSDAIGGVINLISKSSQKEKYEINLKGYYESVGQYNIDLNGGVKFGKGLLLLSGGRNFFDGFSAIDTSRHKDWEAKEQYYANAKYIYTTSKYKIGASLSFLHEMMLNRGNLVTQTTYAFDDHYRTMRPVGSVFFNIPIKDYSKIDLMVGYSGYIRYLNHYKKDLVTLNESLRNSLDQIQDTSIYHSFVARGTYTLTSRSGKISTQFGTDINQEYTKQALIPNGAQTIGDYAVFGSLQGRPIKGLEIQPALRFSYNSKFSTPLTPSLNVRYEFSKYFSLRASYGMGYRTPSLKELYMLFKDSNHDLMGNPDLQPEKGHSVNMGLTFQIVKNEHRFRWINNGFYNTIENKIDYVLKDASVTPNVYQYFNINSYMNVGGEHQVEYGWRGFTAGASALYTWTKLTLGQSGSNPASMLSADATVKLGYIIPKLNVNVIVNYKYSGRSFLYTLSSNNDSEYGSRAPYNTLGFSLSRNFWKDRIQVTAGGKNLFNVTNVETDGAVPFGHSTDPNHVMINWGRSFFISLNLHFAK